MVLAAWYVIEPSRNLERFAKLEESSTGTASGCSNAPVNHQAQSRAVSRAWHLLELPEQLMALAPRALGTLLLAQELNGHVEVLHSLQPELGGGCLHLLLQLLCTPHGSQHVQNLHTHRAKASTTAAAQNYLWTLGSHSGLLQHVLYYIMFYLIVLSSVILMFVACLISMCC